MVNEDYNIVHLSERAGRYLQIAGGEPTQNLLKLVKQELRLELRSALYQAMQRKLSIETRGVTVVIGDRQETVRLQVKPVLREGDVAKGFILVIFQPSADDVVRDVPVSSDEPVAHHLEEELVRVKTQLRLSNEQHDFHAEELKASNEELRSAAEELETSKEELQSINEELRTVNQELKIKIEETTLGNNNLQNLINSANIGTIFLDRSLRVSLFTPAAGKIFNLLPADYGRPLSDITHHLQYKDILADTEAVLEKLIVVEQEVTTVNKQAFLMRILPYRTSDDRINGVVISFFDVTKRKLAEENLRESEERFRSIVNQSFAGITEMDVTGKITFVNERMAELTGYSRAELTGGMAIQDIVHKKDMQRGGRLFTRCAKEGIPFSIEKRFIRKDGTEQWINNHVSLMRDVAGNPAYLIGVTMDINEQKAAAEALRKSEERFRLLSTSGLISIAFFKADGAITDANDAFLKLVGYSREELNRGAVRWDKLTPPEWMTRTHDAMDELQRTGKIMPYEKEYYRRDGSKFWGIFGGAQLAETEVGVAFVMDISELKALEQQKDTFLGIASHELKTPATSIKAYTELLIESLTGTDDESAQIAGKLNLQVDRLAALIHDLLETTRISGGQLILNKEPLDLNAVITEQAEELQQLNPGRKIVLRLHKLHPVVADRNRIAQVLTNIISNAFKYSPQDEKVVITTEQDAHKVTVHIRDHGRGIAADAQQKVFERFYRGEAAINAAPGLGLGLYIASEIIKAHSGTMAVDSKPGQGATFYFTLPL